VVAPGVGDAEKNSVVSIMIPSQVLRCRMPRINTEPVAHRKRATYIKTTYIRQMLDAHRKEEDPIQIFPEPLMGRESG
jgi:hypothetical protein